MTECLSPSLADCPAFRGMSASAIQRLERLTEWRRLAAGDLVIDGRARVAHPVYVLLDGRVDVLRGGPGEALAPVAQVESVATFGEFAAITGTVGPSSVRAATDCVVGAAPAGAYLEALTETPEFMLETLRRAVRTIQDLDGRVYDLAEARNLLQGLHQRLTLWTI